MSARDEALAHYLGAGWPLVPVLPGTKKPGDKGWPDRQYMAEDFTGDVLIGLKLGGNPWLVDIDIDCGEADTLAHLCLPPTLTYRRTTEPRQHRLFYSPGAYTRQFAQDGSIIELRGRASTERTAIQSVLPPREGYEWTDDRDAYDLVDAPVQIAAADLLERVIRLACAVLIMRAAGEAAARQALAGGEWSALPPDVLMRARDWLGILERPAVTPSPAAPVGDVGERARKYFAACRPAVTGEHGHHHTFLICQHATRGFGFDDETAYEVLKDWNKRCDPPWKERYLKRHIADARKNGTTVAIGAHLGDRGAP